MRKVEKLTKKVGRDVRLIVIGPYFKTTDTGLQISQASKNILKVL